MRISFHGAAGCVTGSRHLLEVGNRKILVDCGLFQGLKELRLRNWDRPDFDLEAVDTVLLTHAHIDHSGWLPRAVRLGLDAPVHATDGTAELLELLLLDSAHLQEEDAAWANKKGYSKHHPAEPLYTSHDALRALKKVQSHPFDRWLDLGDGIRARFANSGHLLGASFLELRVPDGGVEKTIVFSGDVGRYDAPLHRDPEPLPRCDALVIESTYGDRSHDREPVADQIRRAFGETIRRRGVVLIPAFAVGRVQQVTLILRDLMESGELADVPIYVDSPMAVDASLIYGRHLNDGNLDADLVEGARSRLFPRQVHLCRTVHESKKLNTIAGPLVIISASGMLSGGRVLHHLTRRMDRPENLILLAGYQAAGTRGRALQEGAKVLRIHGEDWPVRCRHESIQGLSSHADKDELLRWLDTGAGAAGQIFVVHGEPDSSAHFADELRRRGSAAVHVPALGEGFAV
ncbi:MAG TPA: MBL fold metallo-hydrolase [Candidatus Krumholzibacteria bacterium]|nr:MBL fold metallo-hydrolase [Candidatus Krumholzibacteria bacterium]HPD73174.1 MBL fold metallo-hydrolase [Candidatus Krumholzibacteria bacterium]HRY41948.1 MBL fold metallo-hydrolase [Candidatus Krumholzibacteria bacterium]